MTTPRHATRTRIGLVGAGPHLRENLLPTLRLIPGVDLTHVCARREANAQRLADDFGIPHVGTSWESVVSDPGVDALVVSGPPDLHEAVLHASLSAGKPAFVEKPPALTLAGLEFLVQNFPEAAARTAVGFNFRFADAMLAAIEAAGGRDELRAANIRLVTARPSEVLWGQSSVLESMLSAVSIHALELATWLGGEPAQLDVSRADIDDTRLSLAVTISFQGGKVVSLELGNYGNRLEFDVEFVGTKGAALCTNLSTTQVHRYADGGKSVSQTVLSGLKGGFERSGYGTLLTQFIEMVRGYGPSPTPITDAVASLRLIETIVHRLEGIP